LRCRNKWAVDVDEGLEVVVSGGLSAIAPTAIPTITAARSISAGIGVVAPNRALHRTRILVGIFKTIEARSAFSNEGTDHDNDKLSRSAGD
jgi:hypothetical protein